MARQPVDDVDMSIPRVKNVWTLGTVLSATTSLCSLGTMLVGGAWFAAKINDSVATIPKLTSQEYTLMQEVAVLQDQQHYADLRYAEIMTQLAAINQKLDAQYATQHRK